MGLKFADIPNGLGAISKVPLIGWGQILAYGAFRGLSLDLFPGTAASEGYLGFKVLTSSDPEAKRAKLSAELAKLSSSKLSAKEGKMINLDLVIMMLGDCRDDLKEVYGKLGAQRFAPGLGGVRQALGDLKKVLELLKT